MSVGDSVLKSHIFREVLCIEQLEKELEIKVQCSKEQFVKEHLIKSIHIK
jgi:hypothetical protein